MSLAALRETRAARVAEMRGLVDKAEAEKRDLSPEENTRFAALKTEIAGLDSRIGQAETLAELERRAEADPITPRGGLGELELRYSVAKALGEFVETGRLTGLEAEWSHEHRTGRPRTFAVPASVILGTDRRALLTTAPAGGPGGNLVATTTGALIDRVRPQLVTESLGATVLGGLTNNLDLPKLEKSGQAYWVGEHVDVPLSDPEFGKLSMGPRTVGARYEVSRRMLLQVNALETILRADLSYLLREALDGAAIGGVGAVEPIGVLHTPGVPSFQTPIADPANPSPAETFRMTAGMMGLVENASGASRGFLINPKTRASMLRLLNGNNEPFGLSTIFYNEPVAVTQALPSNLGVTTDRSPMLYGVWSSMIIGYWSAIDLMANPYASEVAKKGGIWLHAFLDADVGVRRPEDFVKFETWQSS